MSDSPAPQPAPDSDEPVFEIVGEVSAASTPQPIPPPAPAKPSRVRRLGRWSCKWGKRALLLAIVMFLLVSGVYSFHRQRAFDAGDRALAEVRAELDAAEPGWRYEDIEAAYNARIPPPEKNSFALLGSLPRPKVGSLPKEGDGPDNERDQFGREVEVALFESDLSVWPTNELPSPTVRRFLAHIERELPPTHPALVQLARLPTGGIPMIAERHPPGLAKNPEPWLALREVSGAQHYLELVGVSRAARRDYAGAATCAHAVLNAGRAVGAMPRTFAQYVRLGGALRAARTAARVLAWGEPGPALDELRRELLAEADVEWLEASLKGERAVLNRAVAKYSTRDEIDHKAHLYAEEEARLLSLEGRGVIFFARPYREECRASGLREVTKTIALCKLPTHERLAAASQLENGIRAQNREAPTMFHRWWGRDLTVYSIPALRADCATKATLWTTVAALACEQFRHANRRWPNDLAELVPAILPAVPTDPFDGKPLRYKQLPDGIVVYSVGHNRRDDGGELVLKDYGDYMDIGLRLWNPPLRGLPPKDPLAKPDEPEGTSP